MGVETIRCIKIGCYSPMDANMSEKTKEEVMLKLRSHYRNAGRKYREKLIDQAVGLMNYHRKSAIRALNAEPSLRRLGSRRGGRPRKYDVSSLLPVLKKIWLSAQQPCGKRLVAMLPDWVVGFEAYHRSLSGSVKEQLLEVSSATLDRMLAPVRAQHQASHRPTKPGNMLRESIPIRGGSWHENQAGWMEADTVGFGGGCSSGEVIWMLDSTDICTTWVEMRAMYGRGQHATVEQLADIEAHLPFPWLGLDSDNGGEFINQHVLKWCQRDRANPIYYTRSRPYKSNDNAHIEQKNWTHVRQWFGYERHDNADVRALINELAAGKLRQFVNLFSASLKLKTKEITGHGKMRRTYEGALTPYVRVMASPQVSEEKKIELKKLKESLNPFDLEAGIQKQLKAIERIRRALE
jgi:hypothetical protein